LPPAAAGIPQIIAVQYGMLQNGSLVGVQTGIFMLFTQLSTQLLHESEPNGQGVVAQGGQAEPSGLAQTLLRHSDSEIVQKLAGGFFGS